MALPKEAQDRTVLDRKISEDFLHGRNLQVTKHFENAPTLVWAIEPIDSPSRLEQPKPPIVLTRLEGKEHDTVSIRVNGSFTELTRQQQILSVYYLGQLSLEQGSLDSITLDENLRTQEMYTIIDVLEYSRNGDFGQLINDLGDENGWFYTRFPQG